MDDSPLVQCQVEHEELCDSLFAFVEKQNAPPNLGGVTKILHG